MHDGAEQEGPLRGYARDDPFWFRSTAAHWHRREMGSSGEQHIPPKKTKKNVKVSIEVTGQESRNELYVGAT